MIFGKRTNQSETAREKMLKSVLKQIESEERKNLKQNLLAERNPTRAVNQSIKRFSKVQQPDFSDEQKDLMSIFGQGLHIWGLGEESGNQVTLHQTLHSGTSETGNLFGFGNKNYPNEHWTRSLFLPK